jgi:hypothetical protein
MTRNTKASKNREISLILPSCDSFDDTKHKGIKNREISLILPSCDSFDDKKHKGIKR